MAGMLVNPRDLSRTRQETTSPLFPAKYGQTTRTPTLSQGKQPHRKPNLPQVQLFILTHPNKDITTTSPYSTNLMHSCLHLIMQHTYYHMYTNRVHTKSKQNLYYMDCLLVTLTSKTTPILNLVKK